VLCVVFIVWFIFGWGVGYEVVVVVVFVLEGVVEF